MRVLHFAFGDANPKNPFLPHNYAPRTVAYTGTHDNDTTVGWFSRRCPNPSAISSVATFAAMAMRSIGNSFGWHGRRPRDAAMVPAQRSAGAWIRPRA